MKKVYTEMIYNDKAKSWSEIKGRKLINFTCNKSRLMKYKNYELITFFRRAKNNNIINTVLICLAKFHCHGFM